MVRYSFLVGLFHPQLCAGLSRRLHSLALVALCEAVALGRSRDFGPSRDRQGADARLRMTFDSSNSAVCKHGFRQGGWARAYSTRCRLSTNTKQPGMEGKRQFLQLDPGAILLVPVPRASGV